MSYSYMNMFEIREIGVSFVTPVTIPTKPVYLNGVEITGGAVLTVDFAMLSSHNAGTINVNNPVVWDSSKQKGSKTR